MHRSAAKRLHRASILSHPLSEPTLFLRSHRHWLQRQQPLHTFDARRSRQGTPITSKPALSGNQIRRIESQHLACLGCLQPIPKGFWESLRRIGAQCDSQHGDLTRIRRMDQMKLSHIRCIRPKMLARSMEMELLEGESPIPKDQLATRRHVHLYGVRFVAQLPSRGLIIKRETFTSWRSFSAWQDDRGLLQTLGTRHPIRMEAPPVIRTFIPVVAPAGLLFRLAGGHGKGPARCERQPEACKRA